MAMLRHDPSGTGNNGTSLIAPLEKAWEFKATSDIESPLAAAYGLVFFGRKYSVLLAELLLSLLRSSRKKNENIMEKG
jgi:hypothetical protein